MSAKLPQPSAAASEQAKDLLTGPVAVKEPVVGPSASTRPRRVLFVDDNRYAADSLATLLKLTGHDVYTANDGLDAVEAAEMLQPDVNNPRVEVC